MPLAAAMGLAFACAGGKPAERTAGWRAVSSTERLEARRQRELRRRAFEQQDAGPRGDAGAESPPEPELEPPPAASASAAVEVEPADAGASDAAPSDLPDGGGDASVGDAAPPPAPLTQEQLCAKICDRVFECATEMMGDTVPPEVVERMKESMRGKCMEECGKETRDIDQARECLAKEDCEEVMTCLKDVMGD
jgi:Cys-rich protein (TIGR04453 family)